MYIDINDLIFFILSGLGAIALVYLIITLKNLSKLVMDINNILSKNESNINLLCDGLPKITDNISEISGNMKDVSEVVTEATADVIVAKDSLLENFEVVKDIFNILGGVFLKK